MDNIAAGITRTIENDTALHYINTPASGYANIRELVGILSAVLKRADNDPLLFAYQLKPALTVAASIIIATEKWCVAVIEATPDQIEDSGATL